MDVVVTRLQVAPSGPGQQRPTFREMVRVIWEEGRHRNGNGAGGKAAYEQLFWRLARFWHGLLPALILTINPAINYATFDLLKAVVPLPPGKKRHGPREMFAIGMLSKFCATLVTYPLIRAKVMMMADTKRLRAAGKPGEQEAEAAAEAAEAEVGGFRDDEEEEEGAVGGGGGGGRGGLTPSGPSFASTTSSVLSPSLQLMVEERQGLLEIMRQLVREGGIRELYVGLDGQVINTALKNAVLMNTKDRISRVTAFLLRRLFGGSG